MDTLLTRRVTWAGPTRMIRSGRPLSRRTPAAAANSCSDLYDLMASFWPTPLAAQSNPIVVERMNSLRKFVFSTTLEKVSWNNTTLFKGDLTTEVRKLKQEPGPNIVIMGSGSIVAQLADAGLIDEYQMVLNPLVVGNGRTLFEGVKKRLPMKLAKSRAFGNGNIVLFYEPVA